MNEIKFKKMTFAEMATIHGGWKLFGYDEFKRRIEGSMWGRQSTMVYSHKYFMGIHGSKVYTQGNVDDGAEG